ncbi:ABC transporter ATP-binding protein [Deinococcus sp. QL22]|uniref:ABC transporter ATP-binding protein n=1 Tax=Deinococcus sp. QL22 TaxID=2939437 RepID=UPI002017D9C5|nr:ABC transporter ATP-binding protein [Deinococcus sp. QL22]UQN09431.1 ABC transporter ATP-binding protein/permease [Deinococcus sp. QL22]
MIRRLREDAGFVIGAQGRAYALALAWTGALATGLTLLNPLVTRWIFDVAVPQRRLDLLLTVAIAATLVFSAIRWLDYLALLYQQRLTNRMTEQVTQRMMTAYYHLPPQTVASHGEGYYVARTMTEVQETVGPLTGIGTGLLRAVATLVTALATVVILSWQLTLALLVITPVLLSLSRFFARQLNVNARDVQERTAQQQSVHTQAVGAYRAVRTFELAERTLADLMQAVRLRLGSVYTLSRSTGLYGTLSRMSLGLAEFMVLIAGGYAVMTTSLSLGGLMAYMGAYWLAVNAVQNMIDLIPQLSVLHARVDRLREIASVTPEAPAALPSPGELAWMQVSCGLGTPPTLQEVTFTIPRGARVLISGANGAGKSTLALTALGLLEPASGVLTRPGTVSGLVEPVIFPALPLSTLLAGSDPVEAQRLMAAFQLTLLLERRFTELSLGQRKKFALIMTLLRPADLYVFDEPLANLDDLNRQVALDLMLEHTTGKTVLAVMHEADRFVGDFDLHLEVKDGRVRQVGEQPPLIPGQRRKLKGDPRPVPLVV